MSKKFYITSYEFELVIQAARRSLLLPDKLQDIRILSIYRKRKKKSTASKQNKLCNNFNVLLLEIKGCDNEQKLPTLIIINEKENTASLN